ncbi:hypothetical protein EOA32_10740 [Mesorhizobium sp. M1A.F.Ca.ET.072.01.1.1]|nr:hypothetical protein EOA32_10740 [Mesorhizobium sp. M1A.F.Ca.ET.072.01.1.1]TIV03454.1 MAG: hypothetical protein E5W04_08265 [Mesorhizobium sp.]
MAMFDFENLGQKRQAGILAKVSETSTFPVTRRHVLASSTLPFLVAFAGVRRAAGGSQDPVFQLTKSQVPDRRVALLQCVLEDKGFYSSDVDGLFGPQTESATKAFQAAHGITADGVVSIRTGKALGLPFWDTNIMRRLDPPFRDDAKYAQGTQFDFRSLAGLGNFFSGQPDADYDSSNTLTRRALRTNNPGAINISNWQRDSMNGYMGCTLPDRHGNQTAIYEAPEYGVGAWGFLLRKIYFNGSKDKVTVGAIVDKYRGKNSRDPYIDGYKRYSAGKFSEEYEVDLYNNAILARLAIASYSHEFGSWYPLTDDQLMAGFAVTDGYIDATGKDVVVVSPEEMDPTIYIIEPELELP